MNPRPEPDMNPSPPPLALSKVRERAFPALADTHGDSADLRRFADLLDAMIEHSEDGVRWSVQQIHQHAYPGKPLQHLTTFRKRLNDDLLPAAKLAFRVSPNKRGPRFGWFEHNDPAAADAAALTREALKPHLRDDEDYVEARGQALRGSEIGLAPAYPIFVSCAESEQRQVAAFCEDLQTHLNTLDPKEYRFSLVGRHRPLPAGDTEDTRTEQREIAWATLVFLSPECLDSPATEPDLNARQLLPVGWEVLAKHAYLPPPLEGLQPFTLDGKVHSKCRSAADKEKFCRRLCDQIVERRQRWTPDRREETRAFTHKVVGPLMPDCFEPSDGVPVGMSAVSRDTYERELRQREAVPVVDHLLEWARDPGAAPFFAVLGEMGIGKSTNLAALAQRLLEDRAADPGLPLPVFIDLRTFSDDKVRQGKVPGLEEVLRASLDRARCRVEPRDILELLREEGALLIFDGLDEKLVHLNENQGQEFVRELWNALPDLERPREAGDGRPGKVVFSCRSHYFPTVNQQNSTFRGQDRESVRERDYQALFVKPFSAEQVANYLHKALPDHAERALDLVRSVHNLEDLSGRPYFLKLISEQVPRLERIRLDGRPIRGVDLYEGLVDTTLARDGGKHHIPPRDKLVLMERIAADLWRSAEREWAYDRVRDWLDGELHRDHGKLLRRCSGRREGNAPDFELLEEDFRTATFVLRPDDSSEHFRFAHTSLQEYFLARHLFRSLREGSQRQVWNQLPMPSDETLEFLAELLQGAREEERETALDGLGDLLRDQLPGGTRVAFKHWLLAGARGWPRPPGGGFQLQGLDLARWSFTGDLAEANLQRAILHEAKFHQARMPGARFEHAELHGAEFLDCDLRRARVTGADFEGTFLRRCHLPEAGLDEANRAGAAAVLSLGPARTSIPPTHPPPLPPMQATFSLGHTSAVTRAVWSHNGTRILSASEDHTLKLWDPRSAQCIRTFDGHRGPVTSAAFSRDDQRILSASWDRTLKLWDTQSAQCIHTFHGHKHAVTSAAFSHDEQRILSFSKDHTLKLWDPRSGQCIRTFEGHQDLVESAAFSHDDQRIISASSDRTLKLWDPDSGRCLRTFEGHQSWATFAAFSHDDQRILSASIEGTLMLWDSQSGQSIRTFKGHEDGITSAAFSHDDQRILSASGDYTLKLWDTESGRCIRTLTGHQDWVMSAGFSHDDQRILSASMDNTLKLWDLRSGQCIRSFEGHRGGTVSTGFSHDDRRIFSVASMDSTLKLWDSESGHCIRTLNGYRRSIFAAFSHDDQCILSTSNDNTVKLWDARSGQCIRTFEGHRNWVVSAALTHDDQRILSASWDHTLKLWDTESGQFIRTFEGHRGPVESAVFSRDDQCILSASHDITLKLWDPHSGQCIRTFEGHGEPVVSAAFSHDDQRILSASWDHTLKLWDSQSGQSIRTFKGHEDGITSAAFSHDDQRILSASHDITLKLWDPHSGQCIRTFEGHQREVTSAAFSRDDQRILSASRDHTLKLWHTESGQCIRTYEGHSCPVTSAAFSHDDQRILSASWDGTLKLWDAESGQCLRTWAATPNGGWLALGPDGVESMGGDGWRLGGWRCTLPGETLPTLLPLEAFGEIAT